MRCKLQAPALHLLVICPFVFLFYVINLVSVINLLNYRKKKSSTRLETIESSIYDIGNGRSYTYIIYIFINIFHGFGNINNGVSFFSQKKKSYNGTKLIKFHLTRYEIVGVAVEGINDNRVDYPGCGRCNIGGLDMINISTEIHDP